MLMWMDTLAPSSQLLIKGVVGQAVVFYLHLDVERIFYQSRNFSESVCWNILVKTFF